MPNEFDLDCHDDDSHEDIHPAEDDLVLHLCTSCVGARAGNGFREPTAAQREQVQEMCVNGVYGKHNLYEFVSGTMVAVRSDDPDEPITLIGTWEVMEDGDAQRHIETLEPVAEAFQKYETEMTREWLLGRRIGEPLPQAVRDLLTTALNAALDPPPTDTEVESFITRFEKVLQITRTLRGFMAEMHSSDLGAKMVQTSTSSM
jgi:hypothetical protein